MWRRRRAGIGATRREKTGGDRSLRRFEKLRKFGRSPYLLDLELRELDRLLAILLGDGALDGRGLATLADFRVERLGFVAWFGEVGLGLAVGGLDLDGGAALLRLVELALGADRFAFELLVGGKKRGGE